MIYYCRNDIDNAETEWRKQSGDYMSVMINAWDMSSGHEYAGANHITIVKPTTRKNFSKFITRTITFKRNAVSKKHRYW